MKHLNGFRISPTGRLFILFDILIIVGSLMGAWLVRSQFKWFLYDLSDFIFLFPWVLFTRFITHLFFGVYSINVVALNTRDIARIFKYNALPTVVLLVLRLAVVDYELLRMPFSMIAMEYLFTTCGFLVLRLVMHGRYLKRDVHLIGYRKRLLLWAEVDEISRGLDTRELSHNQNIEIVGILNANPLFWNTEYNNIRIFGDEKEMIKLSAADEHIAGIAFLNPKNVTKKQRAAITKMVSELYMETGRISGNKYTVYPPGKLLKY